MSALFLWASLLQLFIRTYKIATRFQSRIRFHGVQMIIMISDLLMPLDYFSTILAVPSKVEVSFLVLRMR